MIRRRTSRTPIGLEITEKALRAVQLRDVGGRWGIEAAACVLRPDPSAPLREADIERLVAVLDRQNFHGRNAVIAVPASMVTSGVVGLSSGEADVESEVRRELGRMMSDDLDQAEITWWPVPGRAGRSSVLATACPHDGADALLDLAEQGGLEVDVLDLPSTALARWHGMVQKHPVRHSVVLDVGWEYALFVALCEDVVVYERPMYGAGLQKLYETMAGAHGVEGDVVDLLLRDYWLPVLLTNAHDFDLSPQISATMRHHFDELADELRTALNYVETQYDDAAICEMFLVGAGASIPGLDEYLTERIDLTVRVTDGAEMATCPPDVAQLCACAELAVPIGLARHGGGKS